MHSVTTGHPVTAPPDEPADSPSIVDGLRVAFGDLSPTVPITAAEICRILAADAGLDEAAASIADALEQRRRRDRVLIAELAEGLRSVDAQLQQTRHAHAEDAATFAWLRRMVHDWTLDELADAAEDHSRWIEEAFTALRLPLARCFCVEFAATAHVSVVAADTAQAWWSARRRLLEAVGAVLTPEQVMVEPRTGGIEATGDRHGFVVTAHLGLVVQVFAVSPFDAAFDARARVGAQLARVGDAAIAWTDVGVSWMSDEILSPRATATFDPSLPVASWDEQPGDTDAAAPARAYPDVTAGIAALLRAWWQQATGSKAQRIGHIAEQLAAFGRSAHRQDRAAIVDLIAAVSRESLQLAAAGQAHQQLRAEASLWQRRVRGWLARLVADGVVCLEAVNEALSGWDMERIRRTFTVVLDLPVAVSVVAVSDAGAMFRALPAVRSVLGTLLPEVDPRDVAVLGDRADPIGEQATADYVAHLWLRVCVDVRATGTEDAYQQALLAVRNQLASVDVDDLDDAHVEGIRVDAAGIRRGGIEDGPQGPQVPDQH